MCWLTHNKKSGKQDFLLYSSVVIIIFQDHSFQPLFSLFTPYWLNTSRPRSVHCLLCKHNELTIRFYLFYLFTLLSLIPGYRNWSDILFLLNDICGIDFSIRLRNSNKKELSNVFHSTTVINTVSIFGLLLCLTDR